MFNVHINDYGDGAVTFLHEGDIRTVTSDHPNFQRIVHAVISGEDIGPLLDPEAAVAAMDRVSVDEVSGVVYFDGEEIDTRLSRTILRYHQEGRETKGLVNFMERLAQNPSRRSREALFNWVDDRDLVIDEEGYFHTYKGVDQELYSISSGGAFVDGVWVDGHIPNRIGAEVSMPREDVMDDPSVGCSYGLHVGTYSYAEGFAGMRSGGTLLQVRVDPADVVSVPSDAGHQKMRVCRYEVVDVHRLERDDLSHVEPVPSWTPDSTWESLEEHAVPKGLMARLKARFSNN